MVGAVSAIQRGQHRLYRLHAAELKLVHGRGKTRQLSRIKERAERNLLERMASGEGERS
jgi:hypothetical protein